MTRKHQPVLQVNGLSIEYLSNGSWTRAVDQVSFEVFPGQSVGLIGDSGSGKSTIIKAILGLLPSSARTVGEISFRGESILPMQGTRAFRQMLMEEIGLIPQAAMNALDPVLRIDQQFYLAVKEHRRITRKEARTLTEQALEEVGIDGHHARSYPHQLSGGMRQRVLVAMASVLQPSLLIADEPTTGLDVIVQDKVLTSMLQAKENLESSLLFVTHDLEVANFVCDRIIRLAQGRVVVDGTPADLDLDRLWMYDGSAMARGGERALEVIDLDVAYHQGRGLAALSGPKAHVLEGVSLRLHRGEILGVAGESGCGKSTLSAAIAGLVTSSGGSITISSSPKERPLELNASSVRLARRHLQMVFQDPYDSLNPRNTVWETVAEPLVAQHLAGRDGPLGASMADLVKEALRAAELDPDKYAARYPSSLSGGERQRVAIARALAIRPSVLIADEPVSMLDDATAHSIVTLLRRLARERGVAILLVTHSVHLLREYCDRAVVMYLGRVVEQGNARTIFTAPRHPYTRALIESAPGARRSLAKDMNPVVGHAPSMIDKPTGCAFHPRCPRALPRCHVDTPSLEGNGVACWNPLWEVGLASSFRDRRDEVDASAGSSLAAGETS